MFDFISRHKLLSLAFALAIVVSSVFVFRLTASLVYWSDPRHMNQPIAGWMTPRYVARSWSVPPDVLAEALRLEKNAGGRRTTLDRIAEQQERDLDMLVLDLQTAIAAFQDDRDG